MVPSTSLPSPPHDRLRPAAADLRRRLVGRPASAVATTLAAVLAAWAVASWVAASGSYLRIAHDLPTYGGSFGAWFYLLGGTVVAVAALAAALDAGVLPTVLLAAAPVFGWALNHTSAPIDPGYAVTFPAEVALLYGLCFGLVGFLLGSAIRRLVALPTR